jgi:SOS-response transcriptional repressor LexA
MGHIAQIKPYDTFDNVKEHVKRGRILSKGATLTIAADSVTVTDSYHLLAPASGNADDLKTIQSAVTAQAGQIVVLQAAADDKTITVKTTGGNIVCGADFALDNAYDTITLMWTGSKWVSIAQVSNGSA